MPSTRSHHIVISFPQPTSLSESWAQVCPPSVLQVDQARDLNLWLAMCLPALQSSLLIVPPASRWLDPLPSLWSGKVRCRLLVSDTHRPAIGPEVPWVCHCPSGLSQEIRILFPVSLVEILRSHLKMSLVCLPPPGLIAVVSYILSEHLDGRITV